jgi:adenylate cyclase
MLNDYFSSVVHVIAAHGGSVLKFMGDGLLAIFKMSDAPDAPSSAVAAAAELCEEMEKLNRRRAAEGIPHTGFGLALHAGDVMYGNIGAERRLDFTVIGPAVNAAARMQGMCRQLEQNVILSSPVARAVMNHRDDVVSLGRYMLRGVAGPQELFTLASSSA